MSLNYKRSQPATIPAASLENTDPLSYLNGSLNEEVVKQISLEANALNIDNIELKQICMGIISNQ